MLIVERLFITDDGYPIKEYSKFITVPPGTPKGFQLEEGEYTIVSGELDPKALYFWASSENFAGDLTSPHPSAGAVRPGLTPATSDEIEAATIRVEELVEKLKTNSSYNSEKAVNSSK